MRKTMMLAAMLAMVLVAAAPALAQASAVGGDVQIQNQNCPQVITQYANANQSNSGGGTGAGIAQNLGIDQSAVNACLQAGNDIVVGGAPEVVEEEIIVEEFDPGFVEEKAVYPVVEEVVHPVAEEKVVQPVAEEEVVHETAAQAAAAAAPAASAPSSGSSAGTASATYSVLPDTGGVSLLALVGGALLVGGGLVARRVFR